MLLKFDLFIFIEEEVTTESGFEESGLFVMN